MHPAPQAPACILVAITKVNNEQRLSDSDAVAGECTMLSVHLLASYKSFRAHGIAYNSLKKVKSKT
jgi:hypothetical protein